MDYKTVNEEFNYHLLMPRKMHCDVQIHITCMLCMVYRIL